MTFFAVREPQKSGFVADAKALMREFNNAVDALLHIDSNNVAQSAVTTSMAVSPLTDPRALFYGYDVVNAQTLMKSQSGSMTTTLDEGVFTTITDGGAEMVLSFTTRLTMPMVFGAVCNVSNTAAGCLNIDLRFLIDGKQLGMASKSMLLGGGTARLCVGLNDSQIVLPGEHDLRVQVRDRSAGATASTLSGLRFYGYGMTR